MKKLFFTGLVILLPFAVTLLVAAFVVNFLTAPFMGITEAVLEKIPLFSQPFLIFSGDEMLDFFSTILVLALLLGSILGLGVFAQLVIGRRLLLAADSLIHHIPVINKLYATVQDTVTTLLNPSKTSFSRVILVPFPHQKALCLALLPEKQPAHIEEDCLAVFMPGAAMPAMGLMMTYRRADVIYLDMKVEDALKCLLSCGVIIHGLKREQTAA